jgi:hypothetical protein
VVYSRRPCAGQAPTFLCLLQRKVGKRKQLKPLAYKRVPWLGGASGTSGICVLAHSTPVTRQSYFRRRCARRSAAYETDCCVPHSRSIRRSAKAKPMAPTAPQRNPLASHATLSSPRRSRCLPLCPNGAPGFSRNSVVADAKPTAPSVPKRSPGFLTQLVVAEAKPTAPTAPQRSPRFP